MPNVTIKTACPIGMVTPGVAPKNRRVGRKLPRGTCIFLKTAGGRRFNPMPLSTSMLVTLTLQIVGEITRGSHPAPVVLLGWSLLMKVIGVSDHLSGHDAPALGSATFTSRTTP